MIEEKLSEILKIEEFRIRGFLKRRVISKAGKVGKAELYRLERDAGGYEQGTVIVIGEEPKLIRGYPKIKRVLVLTPTIEKHFHSIPKVGIEEKMNGYNVRICLIEDELVALTRGGLVCPYTTHKAEEVIDRAFFVDNPEMILCAEAVGPENPYVPKDVYDVRSLGFFVFDIMRDNRRVPIKEKLEICDSYGIKTTTFFGFFSKNEAPKEIMKIVKRLGERGREGVVVKDPEMRIEPLKYTSSESNCGDLKYAFRFYNDYGVHFFLSRVVREAFQSFEWGENEEERSKRIERVGKNILEPMIETIERVSRGEKIGERVTLRVRDLNVIHKFQRHLRRLGIDASFGEIKEENGEFVVEMTRYYTSTNDKTKSILEGGTWS
jgi:putative ATP-dependent DNA ligase